MRYRVIIVEDDEAVAKLIASVLTNSGFEACGTAATGEDGVALARRERPDVALVDLGLPKMSGEDVIATIREELPATACIALTAVDIPARVLGAMRAGASGYILKPFHASELAPSIEEVLSGEAAPISPRAAKRLLAELRGEPTDARDHAGLTRRELEVLQLLVRGHTYADVASALGIDEGTFRAHVKRIHEKMTAAGKRDVPHLRVRDRLVLVCKVGMAVSLAALVLLAVCGAR